MKHDIYTINDFKLVLSKYNNKEFSFGDEKFIILNEKLFYNNIPMRHRCMWYSMGTNFTIRIEEILHELFGNTN